MAGGNNRSFMELKERFLEKNVVLAPKIQAGIVSKARNLGIPGDKVSLDGIYEFDLVAQPSEDCFDAKGKKIPAFVLDLMENRQLRGAQITKNTNTIRAYYLPWDNGRAWSMQLGTGADYLFTPTLDGCSVVMESGSSPKVSHLNFQNAEGTRVDQTEIDRNITRLHGNSTNAVKTLKKDDYSSDQLKAGGTQVMVTVVGFRDPQADTWDFFYQRRFQTMGLDSQGKSMVNRILQDRLVPI